MLTQLEAQNERQYSCGQTKSKIKRKQEGGKGQKSEGEGCERKRLVYERLAFYDYVLVFDPWNLKYFIKLFCPKTLLCALDIHEQ